MSSPDINGRYIFHQVDAPFNVPMYVDTAMFDPGLFYATSNPRTIQLFTQLHLRLLDTDAWPAQLFTQSLLHIASDASIRYPLISLRILEPTQYATALSYFGQLADYPDPDVSSEKSHKALKLWFDMRGLSQSESVITVSCHSTRALLEEFPNSRTECVRRAVKSASLSTTNGKLSPSVVTKPQKVLPAHLGKPEHLFSNAAMMRKLIAEASCRARLPPVPADDVTSSYIF